MDILSIITALTSIIAIIISVITLKQNSKMIEESTRGYLVVYGNITNFGSPTYYLVLKNFGSSAATINKFTIKEDIQKYSYGDRIPFNNIENSIIAPNQAIISSLYTLGIELTPFTINIEYTSNSKTYKDVFNINPKSLSSNTIPKNSTSNKELRTISYAIQELAQKNL